MMPRILLNVIPRTPADYRPETCICFFAHLITNPTYSSTAPSNWEAFTDTLNLLMICCKQASKRLSANKATSGIKVPARRQTGEE